MKSFLKTAGRVLVCVAMGVAGAMVSGCIGGGASEFETETLSRSEKTNLGWDIFKTDVLPEVCALIESALDNDYFTEEYGEPYFANGGTTWDGQLGLPQSLPCFTEDGIIFHYNEYELVPYSYGSPFCLIPYSTLLPYLTKSASKLLK